MCVHIHVYVGLPVCMGSCMFSCVHTQCVVMWRPEDNLGSFIKSTNLGSTNHVPCLLSPGLSLAWASLRIGIQAHATKSTGSFHIGSGRGTQVLCFQNKYSTNWAQAPGKRHKSYPRVVTLYEPNLNVTTSQVPTPHCHHTEGDISAYEFGMTSTSRT